MHRRYHIVLLIALLNIVISITIWLYIDPLLSLFNVRIYHILLWILLSLTFSSIRTSLPFGKASASLANIIDIAAIATVGPVPIIIANIIVLIWESFKEGKDRIAKIPFNMSLWICAPLLSAIIIQNTASNIINVFEIRNIISVVIASLVYSGYMILSVSVIISITDRLKLISVLVKNYLYHAIASIASIPITIIMIYLWYSEGSTGILLLAIPLLLVSLGVNLAYLRGKLEERSRRDSQLAELGKTTASILHEIKRPISRIMMTAEYCVESQADVDEKEEFRKCLEWSREVGDITKSLLSNISGQISREKVQVRDLVSQVCDLMREKYPDRIRLGFEEPKNFVAEWDAQSISMVLANLITNSLEAGDDTIVDVRVAVRQSKGTFKREKGSAQITIADSGPGLPAVETERLFDPLYSTKESGSGVGLFVAKQIALAHGGNLSARTMPHGGAEFTLQLPLYA